MKQEGAGARGSSILRRDGIIIAAFLTITAIMTNPLVLHIADTVEDKQDGLLNTWIIAWVGHALTTDPIQLFNTNIFYPYPESLAFSEMLLPQGLLALPVNLAGANTVLGYNLVLLFSLFLAAYAMYLLVFDWTKLRGPAFVAGIIFAFNPYNLGNLAQIQLLSFGWMPLALLFLKRVLRVEPGSEAGARWDIKSSIVFALFFSLQALSSIYYAMLAAFAVAFYVVWSLLRGRPRPASYATLALRLVVSGLVIAVLIVPLLLPYLDVQRELGFTRSIQESEPFSASVKLYAEVSPQNMLYSSLLAPRPAITNGCYPLDNLFPGLAALGLAIIGIGARKRDKWFTVALLLVALVFSLGPRLFITPSIPTDLTLPYRWLYDLVPIMHAFRAPVRFAALVMLTLAVLAGFGAERLSKARWPGISASTLSLFLGVFIGIEYLNLPAANITPVPTGEAVPQYVHWLAEQPRGLALELPMIEPNCPLDLTAQYLSTYHWQDTPDGYSGFVPGGRGGIAYEMENFPSERSVSLLQALGVKYVIVHSDRLPAATSAADQIQDLTAIKRFGKDIVYAVSPRAQDGKQLQASVYLSQPAWPATTYTAYLVIRNNATRSYAVEPTQKLAIAWRFYSASQQALAGSGESIASLPLVTTTASIVPVQITTPGQSGDYRVQLSVRGDGLSFSGLEGDLRVSNEEPAAETVLPASVKLAQPLRPEYSAGEKVPVVLDWQSLNKIDAYYSASVRVVDSQGNKVAAVDREPAEATMLWRPGSTIRDQFELVLPRGVPPGNYSIQVLMYQADTGADALLLDEDFNAHKGIALASFEVK